MDVLAIGWEKSEITTLGTSDSSGFVTIVMVMSGGSTHQLAASGDLDFLADRFVGFLFRHKNTENKWIIYDGYVIASEAWQSLSERGIASLRSQ